MPSVKEPNAHSAPVFFQPIFSSPASNLACDEALLENCESFGGRGFLRFWESAQYFVVLGYGKSLEKEVFRPITENLNIPVLRRCSGGGTVLQGPGCLNYTLVLPMESVPELQTISGANCFIMQRIRNALARVVSVPIEIRGFTDLVVDGRKFSGNAQRRKKNCLLFHGAFLLEFDLEMISRILRLPEQQPEYRAGREHGDFLTNLRLERKAVQDALRAEWESFESIENSAPVKALTAELAETKYSSAEWNERF